MGKVVKGQYKVVQDDCRTRIVDYFVDEYKKFHADVKYEGKICYPEKKPHHGPKPAPYHAPKPHPAPAPYHAPAPAPYHAPAYKAPHHAPAYDESPKPFAFEYGVADDYSGAKFNAAETTDG